MINALTVDIEDWYQTNEFNFSSDCWGSYEDRIQIGTGEILEILNKHDVKATFFILGCIAEKHPEIVRKIASCGHEIGSHGCLHRKVDSLTPEEFREDVLLSKKVLEDITGTSCNYFRAPSWTINEKNLWTLEILETEGFICDSSMQPFKTPLSGSGRLPYEPFYPVINGKKLRLLEFPSTTIGLGKMRIPFSGGFYLRAMPYLFVNIALRKVNKERAGMVYVHPWELDTEQPRIESAAYKRFVHYYNLSETSRKLNRLLSDFSFAPLGEIIRDKEYEYKEI